MEHFLRYLLVDHHVLIEKLFVPESIFRASEGSWLP